jgi:hypothetical protein
MPRRAFIPGLAQSLALMGCLLASTAGRAALAQPSNEADAPAPKQPSAKADDRQSQPEGADGPSQPVQRRLPGEVKPEVYYFKDKDGNLRPVPGVRLEQLVEC